MEQQPLIRFFFPVLSVLTSSTGFFAGVQASRGLNEDTLPFASIV